VAIFSVQLELQLELELELELRLLTQNHLNLYRNIFGGVHRAYTNS